MQLSIQLVWKNVWNVFVFLCIACQQEHGQYDKMTPRYYRPWMNWIYHHDQQEEASSLCAILFQTTGLSLMNEVAATTEERFPVERKDLI